MRKNVSKSIFGDMNSRGLRTVTERLCIAAHRANSGRLEEPGTWRLCAAAVTRAPWNKTHSFSR